MTPFSAKFAAIAGSGLIPNISGWNIFAPGILVSIIPKAIGSNSRGSNFLTIARYISKNETAIINPCCGVMLQKPDFCASATRAFQKTSKISILFSFYLI